MAIHPPVDPPDPRQPLADCVATAFQPERRRTLRVFGATVEAVLVPHRAHRGSVPGAARPALRASPAARILAEEAVRADEALAITPNRYPFAADAGLVWRRTPGARDPDLRFLRFLTEAAAHGTTVLWNNIGAAASIPRCHAHLTGERNPFLDELTWQPPEPAGWVDAVQQAAPEAQILRAGDPVPVLLVRIEAPPGPLADALLALQDQRLTPAANLALAGDRACLMPRSTAEIPGQGFPYAFGAAELWGRWCFPDPETFAAASDAGLAAAFATAGVPVHPGTAKGG